MPRPTVRPGVELGLRFTPLDSAGLYFPGGKASYPSSLIMLAVPAQVAGVKRIAVCSPPSKYGKSDLVLAACHELGLTDVFRAGGAAAIAAMAFGTQTIPAVDKIVGPGNKYVQLAKRALAGCVGIDGFLGPSEIVVIADEAGHPGYIAADLIAQAEHDPGSCFLLTTSEAMAREVVREIKGQIGPLSRRAAIEKALADESAIVVDPSMQALIDLANRLAAEHVNVQTGDDQAVLAQADARRRGVPRAVLAGGGGGLRRGAEPLPADEHDGAVLQRHQRVRVPQARQRRALRAGGTGGRRRRDRRARQRRAPRRPRGERAR